METKELETQYERKGGQIILKQITTHVCNNQDLINIRGQWEKQRANLKTKRDEMEKVNGMLQDIKDEGVRYLLQQLMKQNNMEVPSSDNLEVINKQITHLDKEIEMVTPFIESFIKER